MEGFILVQLHETVVDKCTNVDGMYLAYPDVEPANFYVDADGEGYWVTPKVLTALIGRRINGISIDNKLIVPWLPEYLFSVRLESLIHVLESVPGFLDYKKESHQLKLDVGRGLITLGNYGVLKTTTDTDLTWHNVPTLADTQFAIAGNTSQLQYSLIRHGDRIWELKVV